VSSLVFLIEQTAIGLLILLAVIVFWQWREWSASRYAIRSTTFELERDFARRHSVNVATRIILLAEAALIVIGVQRIVAPTVRDDRELRQSLAVIQDIEDQDDDGNFATPTRPPAVVGLPEEIFLTAEQVDLGGAQELQIFVTPTLTPTRVGTIEPAPQVVGCDSPSATLQIPANGMRVFQPIRVAGTASIDDFSLYKLEISGPSTFNQFAVVGDGVIAQPELATLSQFVPAGYEPGTYLFRLTVFDTTATLRASCQVTIYISDPIPTATPLGG
jgi:hypothetical protein